MNDSATLRPRHESHRRNSIDADVILRRFEAHTGIVPTLDGTLVSFLAAS